MKKSISLLKAILPGILFAVVVSCESDSKETCREDEICTNVEVTACCTGENDCVWKYNGREYTPDEANQLAIDVGCVSAKQANKSAGQANDLEAVAQRLRALMNRAREQTKSVK